MKNLFLILSLCLVTLTMQAQDCPMPCNINGQNKAHAGDTVSMNVTVSAFTVPADSNYFTFNSCDAVVIADNVVSLDTLNWILKKQVLIVAPKSGTIWWTYVPNVACGETCSSSCTFVDTGTTLPGSLIPENLINSKILKMQKDIHNLKGGKLFTILGVPADPENLKQGLYICVDGNERGFVVVGE